MKRVFFLPYFLLQIVELHISSCTISANMFIQPQHFSFSYKKAMRISLKRTGVGLDFTHSKRNRQTISD